jgi:hypothetical protein
MQYEKKKTLRPVWIGHDELKKISEILPKSSVTLVYQHRPRRTWPDLFCDLSKNISYVDTAIAAHESNLAFVGMAGNPVAGRDIVKAMTEYAEMHPDVDVTPIFPFCQVVPDTDQTAINSSRQAAVLGFQMLDQMEAEDEMRRS